MEWSSDTKIGYDDLEVYTEYRYVFVSSTGRNHVKMAAFSFKIVSCWVSLSDVVTRESWLATANSQFGYMSPS